MKTQRNFAVAASVLLLHVGAVWALQSGLVRRAVESVVPATLMAVLIAPEPPQVLTPPKPAEPPPQQVVRKAPPLPPRPAPAPQPVARPAPTPAPEAPTATATQLALAPITQPVAPAAPPAPAAAVVAKAAPAAAVELPSTDADYLQNPKPAYPAISRKLREQGKVVVDVLIGSDGNAQQAKVSGSSGFDRLDAAALATVQRWRYVPGKKGGVATAMWFSVPIHFVLE